jgi:hypothetical protein
MLNRLTAMILLVLPCGHAVGQGQVPKSWTTKIMSLVPASFEIRDLSFGHLNTDTLTDAIVVANSIYEDAEDSTQRFNPRLVLIVVQNPKGIFRVVRRNDKLVLCRACGGIFEDPYERVTIVDGSFEFSFSGGSRERWTRSIVFTFEVESAEWLLSSDTGSQYDAGLPGVEYDSSVFTLDVLNEIDYFESTDKITFENYRAND